MAPAHGSCGDGRLARPCRAQLASVNRQHRCIVDSSQRGLNCRRSRAGSRNRSRIVQPEHLAKAGQSAVIDRVYVVTREGIHYYFYALQGLPLLWPHAALHLPSAVTRRLFVNEARSPIPRSSRHTPSTRSGPLPYTSDQTKLYVGAMPYELCDTGLLRLFARYGDINSVVVIRSFISTIEGFWFCEVSRC